MPLDSSPSPRPLDGVRVLDLTRVLAGPYCTMILADLGADVVKVERPTTGDDARQFGPFLPSGRSAYFGGINRGKRSIVLDLKQAEDRQTLLRLIERADVLVENFRPGTMEKLELSAEDLRQWNPQLIYASLSGFGHFGPDSARPAYDIIIQALSGLISLTGTADGQTVKVGTSISDILAGLFGVIGILSALRQRDCTGEGTQLDLSMLDCTVAVLENAISRYSVTDELPHPLGTRHPSITPFQALEASDGPLVVAAGNQQLWRAVCEVFGCLHLVEDPRFATNSARTEHHAELAECLQSHSRENTREYWLEQLEAAGVPAAPIRDIEQVMRDPHLTARGMLHSMVSGAGESFLTAGSPLRMNHRAPELSDRAPELGQHHREVLHEWLDEP